MAKTIPRRFLDSGKKICARCGAEKGKEEYRTVTHVNGDIVPASYCKRCEYEKRKQQVARDPVKNKEYSHKYQKEHRSRQNELHKKIAHENRKKVINAYGGKCVCCGESRIEFLAIDHKNGNGNKMRKSGVHPKTGKEFYVWLIKHNFPDVFQLLCHNCNSAKGSYGACPHEKERLLNNASG